MIRNRLSVDQEGDGVGKRNTSVMPVGKTYPFAGPAVAVFKYVPNAWKKICGG
jgi:hypothetical protein